MGECANNTFMSSALEEHVLFLLSRFPLPSLSTISTLQSHFPRSTFTNFKCHADPEFLKNPPPELKSILAKTTILITFHDFPSPEHLPNLKLVQLCSAGSEHILKTPLYTDKSKKHVIWCSASGVHGPQIGEHIFLTLLSLTHGFPRMIDLQRKHKWPGKGESGFHKAHDPVDLTSFSLGILGYGAIGRQVGNIGKAMGMHPINACTLSRKDTSEKKKVPDGAYVVPGTGDRDGTIPNYWYCSRDDCEWEEFLRKSDVLVITVPLTQETTHMIGKREISFLGSGRKGHRIEGVDKGPYVVNISRGKVIHQDGLIEALKEGILGGASLDVADPEPLPEDCPLWDMENVVITPHISGTVPRVVYLARVAKLLTSSLVSMENGGEAFNKIDRERGY